MALNQIIHELQDMTHLSWAKTRNSSGTAGSFLKAYEDGVDGKTYFKLSNYDAWKGIVGHECVTIPVRICLQLPDYHKRNFPIFRGIRYSSYPFRNGLGI